MKAGENRITLREAALFAMFGSLMFASKVIMEALPNIHLLGMFIMTFTLVYRKKALIPIYIYVILDGVFSGFSMWWIPYLYIWTVLWGVTMLLPKKMPKGVAAVVYCIVCALHGLAFGTLYAPAQMIMFHLDLSATVKWIAMGLPFDCLHAAGNVVSGILIIPLSELLKKLDKKMTPKGEKL